MSSTKLSDVNYPLTLKPSIEPTDLRLYTDIFSLQNTIRIMMQVLDSNFISLEDEIVVRLLDAPEDGKLYGRKDGAWVEITAGPGPTPEPTVDIYYESVILLLHGDGTNGSTVFTDNSPAPKTVTGVGNAQISTAQSKFGGASMYFDGNGDYLTVSSPSDFALGAQDFTIEWWSFRTATKTDALIFSTSTDGSANGGYWIDFSGDNLTMYGPASGLIIQATAVGTADSSWNHWAVTRSGTTVRAFKNGNVLATSTNSTFLIATNARVGGTDTFGGYDGWYNGYIDDLRITKGVARYTADFTPPTVAFPNS